MSTIICQEPLTVTPSHLVISRRVLEQPSVTDSPVNMLNEKDT